MRLFRMLVVVSALSSCVPTATQDNELGLTLHPNPLWDDGSFGSAIVNASDVYGNPGTGFVTFTANAGSLRTPLKLALNELGTVTAQLTCIAVEDPACAGTIQVTATWLDVMPSPSVTKPLAIHATDAFVQACAFENRRELDLVAGAQPLLKLALLDSPPEVSNIGATGIGVFDNPSLTGGLALSIPTVAADPTGEELRVRTLIGDTSNPLVQTFTTWDGHAAARSTFDLAGEQSLKALLDSSAQALVKLDSGLAANPILGPFKGELTVVLHDDGNTAVVVAFASTTASTGNDFRSAR